MTALKIMLGSVALASLLSVFAIQRIPIPEEPQQAKATTQFGETWEDNMEEIKAAALKKADQERTLAAAPKVVPTEKVIVTPPPVTMPPFVVEDNEGYVPPARHKRRERRAERVEKDKSDTCTRHRMRKVYTPDKKSWRCKR
jgi:hypothetical protein